MTGAELIAVMTLVSASVNGVQALIKMIRQAYEDNKDSYTQEELNKIHAAYESLRTGAGGEFTGPQWDLSGR